MGLRIGLGLGLNKQGLARFISVDEQIQLFKQRIENDNGTFESQGCLQDLINQGLFDNANFVLTPNGYKAGKLYALKPENGDLDVTWVRNGNATRVNQNGLIESVGNNVPRLDYLAGNCPSILVENQKTNLILNSENISSSSWNKTGVTATFFPNEINPTGENGVYKLIANNTNSNHRIDQVFEANANQDYVFSFFAKKAEYSFVQVTFFGSSSRFNIQFNLKTKTFSSSNNEQNGLIDFEITEKPNDWCFIQLKVNPANFTTFNPVVSVLDEDRNTRNPSYQGDGVSGIYLWGIQLEDFNLSSYIPTSGTAVTRPADALPPITVPSGTTEIVEALEDGTFNTITTIPSTYTIPFGRFKYILFNGA